MVVHGGVVGRTGVFTGVSKATRWERSQWSSLDTIGRLAALVVVKENKDFMGN
jgi:hypothetical protein